MSKKNRTPDETVAENMQAAQEEVNAAAAAVPESERIAVEPAPDRLATARAARPKADKNESKRDKFYRLAVRRVPKALKAIAAIGALANTSQYERTEEWEARILETIDAAHKAMRQKFTGGKVFDEGFKL